MSRSGKAQDVAFAEAVAELRKQLDARGLVDAAAVAQDFVRGLVHQGWRKVAPRVEDGPLSGQEVVTKEQAHAYAEQARRDMEQKRYRPPAVTETPTEGEA